MKQVLEGSHAVSEAVRLARVQVISASDSEASKSSTPCWDGYRDVKRDATAGPVETREAV